MDTYIQILHLEDDARDAELVQATLQSAEIACRITRVQSRDEFTRALEQEGGDVILADYHLPNYDGMSALRLAQERRPDIPFIFVSGMLGEDAAIEALTEGATDYVLKQKLSRLAPAVARALDEAENQNERTRAETALRESEARYRRITEAITDYMYTVRVVAGQAVETRHGPGCLAVTGYAVEEFAADPYLWIRMIVADDRPAVQEQARRVLAGETAPAIEHRIIRKDGALRWVCNTPVPRRDEQGVLRSYDGLIQDITERKQAEEELQHYQAHLEELVLERTKALEEEIIERKHVEQALQEAKDAAEAASRAKGEFLANMSHELRTPMNAILGYSQLMQRDASLSPEQRENLRIINRSGEHLLDLINDVLDISKIEAGHITLNPVTFDLPGFLSDLEIMFRVRTDAKDIRLLVEADDNLPRAILADQGKLRQILINLLGNAVKFTEHGTIALRVKPAFSEQRMPNTCLLNTDLLNTDNCLLVFEVEDTGVGIGEDELESIFQPFEQSASGRKSQQGTGLGLAISRKYVRMMGGELTVTSQLDKGSLFRFDIVIEAAAAGDKSADTLPRRMIGLAPDQPIPRMVVVEDRAESRALLVRLLTTVGFDVLEAVNGKEAVSIWESYQPHLIWMDMRMPVMDGYTATQEIRRAEERKSGRTETHPAPSPPHTVIIALTAGAFDEQRANVLAAGCDDFVHKPFQEAEIFDAIAKHLDVQYVSAEGTQAPIKTVLMPEDFADLPAQRLTAISDAARLGDIDAMLELIPQIEPEFPHLAKTLFSLTEDFEFERILNTLKHVQRGGKEGEEDGDG